MSAQAALLSRPINFAVVQLPERTFPGVVVQGDTLHSLVVRIGGMAGSLRAGDFDEVSAGLEDVAIQLGEALKHYETVCKERGIALPYKK
jgi:hypothetical protein